MLELRAIDFAYGAHEILRGITLELRAGEITCLLGRSGSGKTTLLQLCAGLLTPQSGVIESTLQRPGPQIGYMQQQNGLLPSCNVRDNIALGLKLLNRPVDTKSIDEVLAQVGLQDKGDMLPDQLSGGQQQRVALAQQLVLQPKLLLLDEPLGALDIVLRQELAQLIKDLVSTQNIAALVVTHQPDEALFLADYLCLLGGTPATLVKQWNVSRDFMPQTAFHEIVHSMQQVAA
jgi:ABC-type nitrate/sulfonate/bicarbonate transport system ATPase subunit